MQRLSLLSGGEKALGAISFLFALFLARPCPFYLLDEVEAALDDTNIGRFVELLRGYSDRAQFVVITHQKLTMEAADCSTASRWAATGSQIVSRRLPREEAEAVSPRAVTITRRADGAKLGRAPRRGRCDARAGEQRPDSSHACATRSPSRGARSPSRSRSPRSTRRRRGLGAARGGVDQADVGVRATAELVRRLEAAASSGT